MGRATELADEADTLVRLHKSSGLGMDPDAAAGLLERQALELRRLERVNAELVEAIRGVIVLGSVRAEFAYLDRGIGTATSNGIAWLSLRAALTSATKETKE